MEKGGQLHAASALPPRINTSCSRSAGDWLGLRARLEVWELW